MFRKTLGVLLVLALVGGMVTGQSFAQKKVFKAAFTTQPPTLDAIQSTTTAARQIAIYLFETLVTIGEGYNVVPQLAESWDISDDKLTYTFKLRKGVKFHNGKTMTATDVVDSFNRYKSSALGVKKMALVNTIEATGSHTVVMKVDKDIQLIAAISMPIPFITVMPSEINAKYGKNEVKGKDLIGTGPVSLISWTPDVAIKFAKFKDYSLDTRSSGRDGFAGRRVVNFDEIHVLPVTEASARLAGIETGEFDFAESLPVTSYDRLKENPQTQPTILKPKWAIVLNINKTAWPTSEWQFRRALAYCLDKEQVMRAITAGKKQFYRMQHSIYYPEQTDFNVQEGQAEFNEMSQPKAKKLLDEIGYKGQEVIYMSNRDYDWMYKAALAQTEQWKACGINVNLQFLDWPSEVQNMRKKGDSWHMGQTGWSPRFDPVMLLNQFSTGTQQGHWHNLKEMESLMQKINTGIPLAERQKLWTRVQQIYWDKVPYLRVGDLFEMEAVRTSVKNYKPFYVTPRFWGVSK